MGLGDRILSRFEEISKADRDVEQIRPIIERARGDSIRPNNLFKTLDGNETVPFDFLDEDEQPHYFLRGSSIDVEGDGAGGESITGWDRDRRLGGAFTVITEQRVLVIRNTGNLRNHVSQSSDSTHRHRTLNDDLEVVVHWDEMDWEWGAPK